VRDSFRLYLQPVKKEITDAKEVSRRIGMVKKEKIKLFSIGIVFLLTKGLLMGDTMSHASLELDSCFLLMYRWSF
jgi:hypothetical protein